MERHTGGFCVTVREFVSLDLVVQRSKFGYLLIFKGRHAASLQLTWSGRSLWDASLRTGTRRPPVAATEQIAGW